MPAGRVLFQKAGALNFGGLMKGPNWAPIPLKGAPGRRRSLRAPDSSNLVPVEGGPGGLTSKLPPKLQSYFVAATDDNHQTHFEFARGRARYELNWPWRATTNIVAFDWPMTLDESEEYYATPKEGVDFMYNAPPGHEQNPLIIRSQTPNMFLQAMVFCKGMCTPGAPETHRFWRMYPGQRYVCYACDAHMELDGHEDVVVDPDDAPLDDEEMAPFAHLEPEFEHWMKRGFPLIGHINYGRGMYPANVTG